MPEIGRIYLLVRSNRNAIGAWPLSAGAWRIARLRSPCGRVTATDFSDFLREHIEVLDGDVSKPGLGLSADLRERRSTRTLDLIVNSSGLTDFNPDLRDALDMNVRPRNTCSIL